MQKTTINVAALCDKAGRKNNQDNIYLSCTDSLLQSEVDGHYALRGEGVAVPPMGTMLVVADGMGGMNAGEVSSQLVVETIGGLRNSLNGEVVDDIDRASAVVRRAVADADNAIKQYVKVHPETTGTGSTLVLLWLLGDKAVVAWCGDSRCYRYNSRRGLEQISHDHSYVQQLVDEGKLSPEMAFGHDQSNIITRCLSDDKESAEPDVKVIDIYRGDMFLLCSDGLCGLLPDDVIEQLLKDAEGDVSKALSNCWRRGADEGWSDNVSIILATVDGVENEAPERKVAPLPKRPSYTTGTVEVEQPSSPHSLQPHHTHPKRKKGAGWRKMLPIIAIVALVAGIVVWLFVARQGDRENEASRSHNIPDVATTTEATSITPAKTESATTTDTAAPTVESTSHSEPEPTSSSHASLMQASGEDNQ